jgi:ribosomal protein S18 acetylase RimI-like enzyme
MSYACRVPLSIREPTPVDSEGIAAIYAENGKLHASLDPRYFKEPSRAALADLLRGDREWRKRPDTLALVAEVGGVIAGYLEAELHEPAKLAECQSLRDLSTTRMHINSLGTADAFKRQGVGVALVTAAEDWARQHGATVVTLETWIESPLSVPFWEHRMGFTRQEIVFRKELQPPE